MEESRKEISNSKYISSQSSNSSYQNSNSAISSIICKSVKKIGEHIISKKDRKKMKKNIKLNLSQKFKIFL